MLEKVLLAVDHSDHSAKALEIASEMARKAGTEVRVLHVQELGWGFRMGEIPLEEREEAEQVVAAMLEKLGASGVQASGVIRSALTSRIAGEIIEEARESGCSGIVMGSRGLSGIEGALVGSTTQRVLHHSSIPVVVVH